MGIHTGALPVEQQGSVPDQFIGLVAVVDPAIFRHDLQLEFLPGPDFFIIQIMNVESDSGPFGSDIG